MDQIWIAVSVLLLAGCFFYRKGEWILNICLRAVLGTIAIYFLDFYLLKQGIDLGIGINAVTVLTSGILGFPGVAAIFGIGIYNFL